MSRTVFVCSLALLAAALAGIVGYAWQRYAPPAPWSTAEQSQIRSLWIAGLPPLPADPSNAVADDPNAVAFGHRLFFDTRLSANGLIACAHCHQPERHFTDGLQRAVALGVSDRNTPSIVGTAYSPWYYWDGRKDSLWAQALEPLEAPNEHGTTRKRVADLLRDDADYLRRYTGLFGPLPESPSDTDRVFANVGKVLAAYERRLMPGATRFDAYVAHLEGGGDPVAQSHLSPREIRGLRLFIGTAGCTQCHNGPLLTNNEFHNTGLLSPPGLLPDLGRAVGVRKALADPFNCAGAFSSDPAGECPELQFARRGSELIGATRTPSLRNLGDTAPFQSRGQFATLAEVLDHYNAAPVAMIGHNEAKPLDLAGWELDDLEAFLRTLAAPVAADPALLAPPAAEQEFSRVRR